jgi:hypothetical protein
MSRPHDFVLVGPDAIVRGQTWGLTMKYRENDQTTPVPFGGRHVRMVIYDFDVGINTPVLVLSDQNGKVTIDDSGGVATAVLTSVETAALASGGFGCSIELYTGSTDIFGIGNGCIDVVTL